MTDEEAASGESDSGGRAGASSASEDVETTDGDSGNPGGRDRFPQWLQAVALVAATLVMASGLVAWWQAAHADNPDLGPERDAALIAGRANIETMNTLDYRQVEDDLAAWESVTTGTLHDQIVDIDEEQRTLLADQKKVSVGEVVDAAFLDFSADSATVIASLEITVQDDAKPDSEPTVKRNRFSADLVKVDGDWLIEELTQVPVNIS